MLFHKYSEHRQFLVNVRKTHFSPNDKVFPYFVHPVIFPNLLAALIWCWLSKLDYMKSWSRNTWLHRFPAKWKYQKIVYIPMLLIPFEAIISAKHVLITCTIVDNLLLSTDPILIFCFIFVLHVYDILANNLT